MNAIWVYLSQTPLLWLAVTLGVFRMALWLAERVRGNPLLNPVLTSVVALVIVLTISGTSYQTYFDGAQFVHFLLGPATVALAVPLYQQLAKLRALALPLIGALLVGSLTVAMGVAEQIGGLPSLTAVLVVLTGILGAVLAQVLLRLPGLDDSARGFAIGVAAHGIGTARALQISAEAGAFAGLAMGLNAAVTTLLTPLVVWLLGL
jgi:putative effector of murein hydrolase